MCKRTYSVATAGNRIAQSSMDLPRPLRRLLDDALSLIAPRLCPACGDGLDDEERGYCDRCRASLEPAPYPRELYEELVGALGRDALSISAIGALYTFSQEGPVQQLVHCVKYLGCYDLGVILGEDLAASLGMFTEFDEVDC